LAIESCKKLFFSLFGKKIKGVLDPLNPNLIHPRFCLPLIESVEHTNGKKNYVPTS
jgi:hypothetical protein